MKKAIAIMAAFTMLLTAGCGKESGGKSESEAESLASESSSVEKKDESSSDDSKESNKKDESSKDFYESKKSGNDKSDADKSASGKKDDTSEASEKKTQDKKESGKSKPDKSESSDSKSKGTAVSSKGDEAIARKALENLFDAIINHDVDGILEYSDFDIMYQMMPETDLDMDISELLESYFSEVEFEDVDFRICSAEHCTDMLEQINSAIEDSDISELDYDFDDIDDMYKFSVEEIEGDEGYTEDMYVIHTGGKWKVDLIFVSMLTYVSHSKQSSADANAKTILNTANSTIMHFDEIGVSFPDGGFIIKSSDAKNGNDNEKGSCKPADIAAAMMKYLGNDFDGVWAVKVSSNLTAEAVYYAKSADSEVIGAYPHDIGFEPDGPVGNDLSVYFK